MATPVAAQETLTENQQTEYDGHFVSFWTDTEDSVSMTLEEAGSYSVDWQDTGNFVVGMGWNPGGRRTIEYDATHNPTDNSYLCLYGWTTDPLVEYYIIENYGTYRPGDEEHGSHESDGGTYDIATSERIEQPPSRGRRRSRSTGVSARTHVPAGRSTSATTSTPGRAPASSWGVTTTRSWPSKPTAIRRKQCLRLVQ